MTNEMPKFPANDVSKAFVEQYYAILSKCPEIAHKFYQESSQLAWPGINDDLPSVTTLDGIHDKIISSEFQKCYFETKTVDAQESLDGGIIVSVTGSFTGTDDVTKNFFQTFFLAKKEKGFFVLNDILRFVTINESLTQISAPYQDMSTYQEAVVENSVPASGSESELVENGNVKEEASDVSVSNETAAKVADSSSSIVLTDESAFPSLAPPLNVKRDASQKITYASMVAKKSPLPSPKASKFPLKSDNKTTKSAESVGDGVSRVSTPRDNGSKSPSSPSNTFPKAQRSVDGSNSAAAHAEGKSIYVGRLPYDVTKQGVADVFKQFGPVKRTPDSIQIRRHEDGFCCGFVEFESVDSARRAIKAHNVKFGNTESYITYKRSYANRGNNEGRRSPSRNVGFQNANATGRTNHRVTYDGKFQDKTGIADEASERNMDRARSE